MARSDGKTVMTQFSKSFWVSLTCSALLLSGCAGATNQTDAELKTTDTSIATVKPGAALQFSSLIDGELVVGAYSDVEITIAPGYDAGLLQATAQGTKGLDVLASSAQLSHDMSTGQAVWRVTVRPSDDGLHYLNIMATVSGLELQEPTARAFSVVIDPGTKSEPRDDGSKPSIVQSDTENLAIFEAEETMIPEE